MERHAASLSDRVTLILQQGMFCWIQDEAIHFPGAEEYRDVHATRGCVVVTADALLRQDDPLILVVPTTSKMEYRRQFDVLIPSPPVPRVPCLALVEHVQPVLREQVSSRMGRLPQEYVDEILAALIGRVLGVEIEDSDEIPF